MRSISRVVLSLSLTLLAFHYTSAQATSVRLKTEPLKVGETAPDFTLPSESGKQVKLSGDKQNTLLVFYRGYW